MSSYLDAMRVESTGASEETGGSDAGLVLAIHNLEVVYSDVVLVLRGVSIDVPDGSIVAVLGPNGAGKTTLLRAITGLLPVHRGKVTRARSSSKVARSSARTPRPSSGPASRR